MSVFLIHFIVTFILVGLIWTIQLVHYPSFLWVNKDDFRSYACFHANRISLIVVPLMLAEAVTAVIWMVESQYGVWQSVNVLGIALVWLSTFYFSVPCHNKLQNEGWNESTINRLVLTNWPRTLIWTSRGILLICFFAPQMHLQLASLKICRWVGAMMI